VAHVLLMATLELGDPVGLLILVIADDLPLQELTSIDSFRVVAEAENPLAMNLLFVA